MRRKLPRRRVLALAALVAVAAGGALTLGCSSAPPAAPMATVASVDLARYAGTWYEIASIPNSFQKACVADTRANYTQVDGDIVVDNRCRQADGSVKSARGIAKVVDGSGNAQLRVSFFRPFYGDYWVLALAPGNPPDYGWVLVGEPGRRYGWVLARDPNLSAADLEAALAQAVSLGYDRAAFRPTPQTRRID